MVRQLGNDLALVGAGLTGVSADIADGGVVQDALVGLVALVAERLTVDEDAGDAGVNDLVDGGVRGGGLDEVQDDGVHALGDEVVDLVVLLGHVVLAVDDGHVILDVVGLEALEVVEHLVAVEGHEVVIKLIDGNTDLVGLGCCVGGSRAQRKNHDQREEQCERFFHFVFPPIYYVIYICGS